MKITALSTGTLELKPTFLEGSPAHGGGLGLIRAIGKDPRWTNPLPMWAWVVETDTQRFLIDAGSRPGAQGGPTKTRFTLPAEQELVTQLAQLGWKPSDFDRVLMTHLHGDHVGGLNAFSADRVWVAQAEWKPVAHFPGSLMRPLTAPVPRGFRPQTFDFTDGPVGAFDSSWNVTPDGSIVALPTPGHSPGHTSYLIRTPGRQVLIAGDVTYDLPALEAGRQQGSIAKPEAHRETLKRVLALVKTGVAYLPSHDPLSPGRLE